MIKKTNLQEPIKRVRNFLSIYKLLINVRLKNFLK